MSLWDMYEESRNRKPTQVSGSESKGIVTEINDEFIAIKRESTSEVVKVKAGGAPRGIAVDSTVLLEINSDGVVARVLVDKSEKMLLSEISETLIFFKRALIAYSFFIILGTIIYLISIASITSASSF